MKKGQEYKKKLTMKEARDNFMMVGMPDDRPKKSSQ